MAAKLQELRGGRHALNGILASCARKYLEIFLDRNSR
jgi:hypothetical protein